MSILETLSAVWAQSFFIATPPLTEKNLPDQSGRVFIVTGGYVGCGYELAKILYQHNGTVYLAGRSKDKADKALSQLKSAIPNSTGKLEFLHLDLADITGIKKSADEFLAKESRLDVLTNNAGVMAPPKGSTDAHGREQQISTNGLGPWLFTHYLTPILQKTAASSPPGTVRVTFASSIVSFFSPKGGVVFDAAGQPVNHGDIWANYGQSKAANNLLASEFSKRFSKDGIVSVSWNPGNLKTELSRHGTSVANWILHGFITHPAVFGAYTELYAGWSEDIGVSQGGAMVVPWGRVAPAKADLTIAAKSKEHGGTGEAERFWEWCESESKAYL